MKKILLLAVLALSLVARGDVLLTNAVERPGQLGGASTTGYDLLVIKSFTVNPQSGTVSVNVDLTVSSDPSRPVYQGVYIITSQGGNPNASLVIEATGHDYSVNLGGAQVTAAQADIADFVSKISTSLTGFNVIAGTVQ